MAGSAVLQAGQRVPLATLGVGQRFNVEVHCTLPGADIAAFGLHGGRLADDRYKVFFNQPRSPEGALTLARQGVDTTFDVNLAALPAAVTEIYFTATHDTAPIAQAGALSVRVGEATFDVKPHLKAEKAVMLLRLYRHADGWRLATVAQGFGGGLDALVRHFGGEVEEQEQLAPAGTQASAAATPSSAAPEGAAVNLRKVTLGKNEQVRLNKAQSITATLEWAGKGDLDLYAFYVLRDGTTGKVYYRKKGKASAAPYITLDGDSRVAGRETVQIHRTHDLLFVLFAAYSAVGNGTGSLASYQPRAIITDPSGQEAIIPMLHTNNYSYWVALSLVDFSSKDGNIIRHVEQYSAKNSERSPVLHADGRFEMDRGSVEFKIFGR